MSFLTGLAVSRPWLTALVAAVALLLGTYAAGQLNAELIPEIDFPVVTVATVYPGAGPEDIAEQISKPVEAAITGMPGLRSLQSTSAADLSLVVAEFAYGTDMKKAEADMAAKVRDVALPNGAQQPKVARVDPNRFPVVRLSIAGDADPAELERLVRGRLVPALAAIPGVHSIDVQGGAGERISVLVDPKKAKEKGVSPQQIAALLQANNLALPGGNVAVDGESVPVRTIHTFGSLSEIENLVIGMTGVPPLAAAPSSAGLIAPGIPATSTGQAPSAPRAPPSPVASPRTAQVAGAQTQQYVVKPGDSLWALAQRFSTSVEAIAKANRLANPNLILVGQTLAIPLRAQAVPSPPQVEPAAPSAVAPQQPPNATPQPVALKDVAEVRLESGDAAIVRTNGRRSIALSVTKTQEANAVKVAKAAIAEAQAIGGDLDGKAVVTIVLDESTLVQRSIDGLLREGGLGALLAVIVVLVFLTSLRGALTVAVSIPLSLMVAFLLMWWQGFTLNIMTLGGLAVAIGRVVDDSIVVSESILRRVHAGEPLEVAVRAGTAEVISPITSSTLTTVAVFLPLGLVSGLAGQVFRPFAVTVSFALIASLLCAVTVIPAIARIAVSPRASAVREGEGRLPALYGRLLRRALRQRRLALGLAALLFVGSLTMVPFIPRSFLPSEQEKALTINLSPPAGAGKAWLNDKVPQVEGALQRTAGAEVYQASLGGQDDLASLAAALRGQDPNAVVFLVRFARTVDLAAKVEELRGALAPLLQQGGTISIAQPQSAANSRLQVLVSGDDAGRVSEAAAQVLAAVESVRGLANVASDAATTKREFTVAVDPNKALAQGLTTAQIAMQVRQMFAGQSITQVRLGDGDPLEVRLGLSSGAVASLDDLRNLPFGASNPQPLSALADIKEVERPTRVTRIDRQPGVSITGDIVAQNTGEVASAVQQHIAALALPEGVRVQYGGAVSEMEDSFAQMYVALGLAVVAVFAVMALFFGSAVEPVVILAALPLAAIGALLALLATGRALGLPALIGLLMLIGIVVTNAIVLVDLAKRLLQEGRPVEEAILTAGRIRLRPVLMTALTTMLALLPLALGFNEGAIIAAELATVVIGGLLSATLLTLLVVPVAYALVRRKGIAGP